MLTHTKKHCQCTLERVCDFVNRNLALFAVMIKLYDLRRLEHSNFRNMCCGSMKTVSGTYFKIDVMLCRQKHNFGSAVRATV